MGKLNFSISPHIKSGNSTRKIMLNVAIALLPACIMGIVYFGLPAFLTILVSVVAAVGSEVIYRLIMREKFMHIFKTLDGTSLVTGLIVALILPANYHLYIPALASIFAIIVAKMLFGGTGFNFVNPAAAGRIFAFISFTVLLNTFTQPLIGSINGISPIITDGEKVSAGATTLQNFLNPHVLSGGMNSNLDLFLGSGVAGCIGETCKVAILVGAIYLAIRGIIKIWLPVISIALAGLTAVMLNGFDFNVFLPAILSGGLMFGAFFMATDYVTNPATTLGNIIFFALFGILTSVLRHFTGLETTSFVILLMNILVPLIDKISLHKPFGYVRQKKAKKEGK